MWLMHKICILLFDYWHNRFIFEGWIDEDGWIWKENLGFVFQIINIKEIIKKADNVC